MEINMTIANEREPQDHGAEVEVDHDSIEIDFKLPKVPAVPSGPEDYSQLVTGTVFATRQEVQGNDDGRVEIGTLTASIIQLSRAIDEGWNLYDILDAPSHSTAECLGLFQEIDYNTLRLKSPDYNARVRNLFKDDVWVGDILLVEKIEIQEEYRGHDSGLFVMRTVIDTFGHGRSLVVCKPFPLQYSSTVTENNHTEFQAALKKLRKYWSRSGFKRVPKTDLYALLPHHRLPPVPTSKS